MAKIGFTCGVWDLFHPGHIMLLGSCRNYCDELVVGLQTSVEGREGKAVPIQSVYERYVQLESCSYVDRIIPYESEKDLELIFHFEEMNVRFLGSDYIDADESTLTGYEICRNNDIEFHYIERSHALSSSELRQRIKKAK